MVKTLSILFFIIIIFFFLFFLFSLFSLFLPPFSVWFFKNYFVFTFFSGHKTTSCSDFPLKPPTKHFDLSPSSYDSHLPHSPTPLQFYLARVGGFEVCFSHSCVFSPSGPQPPQTPHSTTLVQQGFMQKRTTVMQLQIQQGSRWPKPVIAPVLDHCFPHCIGRRILPAGGGFRKNGAEACPAMELEFPFPTHLHCRQQPTFP